MVAAMKITLTLPDNLARIYTALAEATRRPAEEIMAGELAVAEHYTKGGEFMEQCEIYMRDDEQNADEFVARMAAAFERMAGQPLNAVDCDLMRQRLDGEIDEEEEVLLRHAARLVARS